MTRPDNPYETALRGFIQDTPISEPNDGWAKEVGGVTASPRYAAISERLREATLDKRDALALYKRAKARLEKLQREFHNLEMTE